MLCTRLQLASQWYALHLNIPHNSHLKQPPLPHTYKRRWLMYTAQKLYAKDQEALFKWGRALGDSGRQAAYLAISMPDHEYMLKHMSLSKSPYQPLPYIKHLPSPTVVRKLLLIRAQCSQLPAHIALHKQRTHTGQIAKKCTRTPYHKRICPLCLPPQNTWGLLSPNPASPLGTEAHVFLSCPSTKETRMSCIPDLNTALRRANIPTLHKHHPWTNLPAQNQLQMILATIWPPQWKYKKRTIQTWYSELDNILSRYLHDILPQCTAWLHQQ
jgi:hypothetical protein